MLYLCILLLTFIIWLLYEKIQHSAIIHNSTTVGLRHFPTSDTLKLCLITDLHNNKKDIAEIKKNIGEYSPSAILLAGDMVDKHNKNNKNAQEFIKVMAELAPVYYSYGNHEESIRQKRPADWQEYLAGLPENVIVLDNNTVDAELPGATFRISISGLSLSEKFYKRGALYEKENELPGIGRSPEQGIRILLAHHPEYAKWYGRYKPDLVLSGHLHGGLLRLPGVGGLISPRLRKPKEDAGEYPYPYGKLFISRGLGSHTIPLRFFNRVEINYIQIMQE